ncbi:MAG: hypothetical protein SGARI_006438 [Bacillariaceae sp.]
MDPVATVQEKSANDMKAHPPHISPPNASRPGARLRQKIQTKLKSEDVQKRKQQAGKAFKNFGSQLQKINLGKLIDQMEQDQGVADSLESLNDRMREETERHEVRREAEARMLEVIQDHLEVFLQEHEMATYEDWIEDLHPENANQGKLLSDIQEIDQRYSDHRRLWNEAIEKLEDNEHRIVEARTQIWGKADGQKSADDLISGSVEFGSVKPASNNPTKADEKSDKETETIDFFASAAESSKVQESVFGSDPGEEPSEDLIKF